MVVNFLQNTEHMRIPVVEWVMEIEEVWADIIVASSILSQEPMLQSFIAEKASAGTG